MFMLGLRFTIYTLYAMLYVFHILIDSTVLHYTMGLVGLIAIIISFSGANRTYQVLTVIFSILSIGLFVSHDLPLTELPLYFTSMALLLALLYMIPFINHLMIVGRYEKALYQLLQLNTVHLGQFYRRTSLTHYLLGLFVFLSAIPIVYRFVHQKLKHFSADVFQRFATQSMLRSLATVNVWSPIEVYIALVLGITSVSYLHILPWLLLLSICILLVDWMWGHWKYRRYVFPQLAAEQDTTGSALTRDETTRQTTSDPQNSNLENVSTSISGKVKRKILSMLVFLILFMTTVTIVHFSLNIEFFDAVIIVIFPYTLLWSMVSKRAKTFLHYHQLAIPYQMQTLQNFMLLFLALGFFNDVIERTSMLQIFQEPFSGLGETPLLLFVIIQLSALCLAILGIHPLVTLSLQGILVEPFLQDINPMSIAIVMITAILANDAAGTFNAPITMMSQYIQRNPYLLTYWNLPFALFFGGMGVLFGYLLL